MQILKRPTLPMVPEPTCPAATKIDGVTPDGQGIICGVMHNDLRREEGLGMSPVELAVKRGESAEQVLKGALMTVKSDPSTIARLCCGREVPVTDRRGHYRSSDGGSRQSYSFCPVFQAEKMRIEEERKLLAGGMVEKPPIELVQPEKFTADEIAAFGGKLVKD